MVKKNKISLEVDETKLKNLNMFESISGEFNTQLGFSTCYTRVYGGIIRLVITPESVSQIFIALPASYFVIK